MPNFVAHKVYAEHLSKLGKGLPMWFPEPDHRAGEVEIGDVGVFLDGRFRQLFNVVTSGTDESLLLPDELNEPPRLQYNSMLEVCTEQYMNPGPYSDSMNITRTCKATVQGGASMPSRNTSAGWILETNHDSGGLLVLHNFARACVVGHNSAFADYVRKHHWSWYQYIRSIGYDCKPEEVVLVRGWIKTTGWSVAAFKHEGSRKTHVRGTFTFPAAGSRGGFNMVADDFPVLYESRSGPHDLPGAVIFEDEDNSPCNQCVFLPVYKVKYRLFFLQKIQAAAGPDQLPHQDNSDFGLGSCAKEQNNLPVDTLLDYLLTNCPEADMAIACDDDVNKILDGEVWPEDLAEYLTTTKPAIHFDPRTQTSTLAIAQQLPECQPIGPLPRLSVREMNVESKRSETRRSMLQPYMQITVLYSQVSTGCARILFELVRYVWKTSMNICLVVLLFAPRVYDLMAFKHTPHDSERLSDV